VGFLILSELEKGKKKRAIVEKVVASFKVKKAQAERDFKEFVETLKKKDLIVGKK
jgi:Fic family protein